MYNFFLLLLLYCYFLSLCVCRKMAINQLKINPYESEGTRSTNEKLENKNRKRYTWANVDYVYCRVPALFRFIVKLEIESRDNNLHALICRAHIRFYFFFPDCYLKSQFGSFFPWFFVFNLLSGNLFSVFAMYSMILFCQSSLHMTT